MNFFSVDPCDDGVFTGHVYPADRIPECLHFSRAAARLGHSFPEKTFDEPVEDITDNEIQQKSYHVVFLNLCHALSRRQVTKEFGGGFSEEGVSLVR